MSDLRAVIAGIGSYLPERIMLNAEMATIVDTSDEWIVERSGIRQRHIAAEGEYTSDLAIHASQNALDHAGMSIDEIDMIIVATTTPDETMPSTAVKVQAALGMVRGAAFDIQAACSGFVYGLSICDSFIKSGQANTILLVGAETLTRVVDWKDRATCVLFGDGAGAVVVQGRTDADDRGIVATELRSDGRQHDILYANGGPSTTGTAGAIQMKGKEVFRQAVTNLSGVIVDVLKKTDYEQADIDLLIPHQANKRIIDSVAKKMGMRGDQVLVTIADHGNTSAASVPLAMDQAVRDGRIKEGDILLLEAMGAGLTWGACVLKW
ncbi:MAG: ketoacyl-ACP synthase III [Alphaproteobacteria bacterium]|nr:MAG: ketoacyl-ACP synthase III [Alphaproteobacteria bacterium]